MKPGQKYIPDPPRMCWEIVAINPKSGVTYIKQFFEQERGVESPVDFYDRISPPYDGSQPYLLEDGRGLVEMALKSGDFITGDKLFGKEGARAYQFPDILAMLREWRAGTASVEA